MLFCMGFMTTLNGTKNSKKSGECASCKDANKMNKSELVTKMAAKAGLSKEATSKVLDAFISTIIQALHDKQEVQLVGFGSFYIGSRSAIVARNPKTGEQIHVPATNFPKFKAGKLLKDAVE